MSNVVESAVCSLRKKNQRTQSVLAHSHAAWIGLRIEGGVGMRTIRRQLTWKLLLAFTLPLIIGGIAVFLSTRAALLEQFDTTLRTRALAIVTVTRQSGGALM